MSSIQTGIELNDQFSGVLYGIINAVNVAVNTMEEMQQTMNSDIDSSSFDEMRNSVNSANAALEELNQTMQELSDNRPVINTDAPMTTPTPEPVDLPPVPEQSRAPPVEVPVVWNTDGLEVFNSSGLERFQQEVQSANGMLEQLSSTQAEISQQAQNIDLFPPEAIQDLNSLSARMDMIRNRIQQIENNPLNMGTDTANEELELLRSQLHRAVQEQNQLNQAVQNMDVSSANAAYLDLSQTIGNTERYIRDNVDEQGRFNQEISEGVTHADNLANTIKNAVAAYIGLQTVGDVLNISDELVQTTSRLNMMNDGLQTTDELVRMVYNSAQDARGSFSEMANVVARFGNNAGDAFSSSAEIVDFAELVQKQMTIAGASTTEAANAMLQLSQGLGSGVLRGDELNSIFEQAPNLIQNIADYLDVPIGQIREMASEGELTADIVKNAIFAATDEINANFESMPKTWGQIWQGMKNTALMTFQPILQRLNEIANSDAFQNFVDGAITAMGILANVLLDIFDLIGAIGGFFADNWSLISPIIYGIVTALGVYTAALVAYNTVQAITNGIKAIAAFRESVHAAATMLSTGATFAATAAQYGLNAALLACPLTWVIALVIALVVVFYIAIAAMNELANTSISATGIIMGAFATLGAYIYNVFALVWNFVSAFIEFLVNVWRNPQYAIQAFAVNVATAFLNFILACVTGTQSAVGIIVGLFFALGQAIMNVLIVIYNIFVTVVSAIVNLWNMAVFAIQLLISALAIIFLGFVLAIVTAMQSGISVLVGLWYAFVQILQNILIAIFNGFMSVIEAVVNGWNSGVYNVKSALVSLASGALGAAQSIASSMGSAASALANMFIGAANTAIDAINGIISALNAIPGVNISAIGKIGAVSWDGGASQIADTVSGLQASLGDAPTEWKAPSLDFGDIGDAFAEGQNIGADLVSGLQSSLTGAINGLGDSMNTLPETWEAPTLDLGNLGDAFNEGKEVGADLVSGLENTLNNTISGLQDSISDVPENYWEAPTLDYINLSDAAASGYELGEGVENKIADFDLSSLTDLPTTETMTPEEYGNMLDNSGLGSDVGDAAGSANDAAGSAADIADSLDVTNEELKYLRDIAEQETVNKFTTAEIIINQTNNNTVSNDMDLDGVVTGLTDAVNEAVETIAEGVHE